MTSQICPSIRSDGIFYATERFHIGDFSYNITFRSDEGVPDDILTDGMLGRQLGASLLQSTQTLPTVHYVCARVQ
jgi:hypothetical protein